MAWLQVTIVLETFTSNKNDLLVRRKVRKVGTFTTFKVLKKNKEDYPNQHVVL